MVAVGRGERASAQRQLPLGRTPRRSVQLRPAPGCQDPVKHRWVRQAGDDPHRAAAVRAAADVDCALIGSHSPKAKPPRETRQKTQALPLCHIVRSRVACVNRGSMCPDQASLALQDATRNL